MSESCFHCGEANPIDGDYSVEVFGQPQHLCCPGCMAVCQTILDQGLSDYYKYRSEKANKANALVPEELSKLAVLDDDSLQQEFVTSVDNLTETILTIDGINCSACAWLIERQLSKLKGIDNVNVNATNQRATVRWDDAVCHLSDIIDRLQKIGYQAFPFKQSDVEVRQQKQNQQFIRRLGVAGLFSAQVMMYAFCLYFGVFNDLDESLHQYFRLVSLLLATPVVLYSAQPFLYSAYRSIRNGALNMDVPVSIAIYGAFGASLWATLTHSGEVYFESISMFTFLLLIGRYLEFKAKSQATAVTNNLLKYTPLSAVLVSEDDGSTEVVTAKSLIEGDVVRVKAGEMLPCDGSIVMGSTSIDESMVSGEHTTVRKEIDDQVLAGSINHDGVIDVKVSAKLADSLIYSIIRMQQRASDDKPQLLMTADKVARYFVSILLVIAAGTAFAWSQIDPDKAFWITLSVLVATCPCALSLATPTALAAAAAKLNQFGIYLTRSTALEDVNKVTDVVFDKTGTLTNGRFTLTDVITFNELSKARALSLAAGLESYSEHALAKPFKQYEPETALSSVRIVGGQGIEATYQGKSIKLGNAAFCLTEDKFVNEAKSQIYMSIEDKLVAEFILDDNLRDNAVHLVNELKRSNLICHLLTGDSSGHVEKVGAQLPLDFIMKGQSPAQKQKAVESLQQDGKVVMMLGDGINDAPVLASAAVSISMGEATEISKASSDVLLLNNNLSGVSELFATAKKTQRIIKQNLAWSIGYNALILPLAVMGHVTPYIAVIGMSASSIIVVSNSIRLMKK